MEVKKTRTQRWFSVSFQVDDDDSLDRGASWEKGKEERSMTSRWLGQQFDQFSQRGAESLPWHRYRDL